MANIKELVDYLDSLLQVDKFQDYAPNGLQVEGCEEIKRFVTGVTASQALLDDAVRQGAHLVLVHHGYFWQNEYPCVVGIKHKRLKTLLTANINLVAYHLPLDAHPVYGNNVQLAKVLGVEMDVEDKQQDGMQEFMLTGHLQKEMTPEEFSQHIAVNLNRLPLHIAGNSSETIKKIAWCAGGAADLITCAYERQADAYLTGEITEKTVHIARELGIHLFAAGHHATERYGIQALGKHLAKKFNLEHNYIELNNPV